jgi:hypothetical protein
MSRLAVLAGVPERHLLTCEVIARLYKRHCSTTAASRQSIARSTEETDIAALAVNSWGGTGAALRQIWHWQSLKYI